MRLRAFGNFSYRIADAKKFHTEISGTRDTYTAADLDGQLRGLMLQHISDAVAQSGVAFLDLAANQVEFAQQLQAVLKAVWADERISAICSGKRAIAADTALRLAAFFGASSGF